MKNTTGKLIRTMAVAVLLSLTPLAAFAQTSPAGDTQTTATDNRDDDHDYGWVGLIGLLGLAGLMRKRTADDQVRYSDATRART
jgi:hypothetical protein